MNEYEYTSPFTYEVPLQIVARTVDRNVQRLLDPEHCSRDAFMKFKSIIGVVRDRFLRNLGEGSDQLRTLVDRVANARNIPRDTLLALHRELEATVRGS